MTNPTIRIHNAATNEIVDREMTASEFNAYKATQAEIVATKTEAETKAAARAAILERLGLTAEEAAILLS
jgi:hypothetical protein